MTVNSATPHPAAIKHQNAHRIRRIRPGSWRQFNTMRGYEWTHATLPIAGLPPALANLRLIHLTDLHMRDYWPRGLDEILDHIAANPPDAILFTGDFVDDKLDYRPALPQVRRFLERLPSRLGTYAIPGNHDGLALSHALGDLPVTLLDGQRLCLDHHDAQIELIGLPGPYRYDLTDDFLQSLPASSPQHLRIILSHFPSHWPAVASLNPALFLAGHTHGGQICLPNGLPILRHDPMPRRLCTGINRLNQTWHIVGRGLGWSGLPFRIFCPSQVIEIELIAQEPARHADNPRR